MTRPNDSLKKKELIKSWTLPSRQTTEWKESEKRYKYIDVARELKKLWNIKVTIIEIEVGALETIPKGLIKWLEN